MIKKFKNGKLKLSVPKNYRNEDGTVSEKFYHGAMFRNKLYIDTIDGKWYLIDLSTRKVYDFYKNYIIQNPIQFLLDDLTRKEIVYLPAQNSKVLFALYMKEYSAE